MTRALAVLLLLTACKPSQPDRGQQGSAGSASAPAVDAGTPDANLDACRAASTRAAGLPIDQRAQALLDGCQPCGSWTPLLDWNTLPANGGPTRPAVEQTMLACKAFCTPTAKQLFLDGLDKARGQRSRLPWRLLGEQCHAQVSAVPDTRYMNAAYFALDRIARALGDQPPLTIALPAISISGVGVELASPPAGITATAATGPSLTVNAAQLLLGTLPLAELSASGVHVTGDYPGTLVEPAALAAKLPTGATITLLIPQSLPARRIVDAITAAGGHPARLAVALPGPGGWSSPGALPIDLLAAAQTKTRGLSLSLGAPDAAMQAVTIADAAVLRAAPVAITVDATATVSQLLDLLAALAAHGATAATLTSH